MPLVEPMRDVIGRALYEEPVRDGGTQLRSWYNLSEDRREPWRQDADRAIEALKTSFGYDFGEFAYEHSGADWLAMSAPELWREFFAHIQKLRTTA